MARFKDIDWNFKKSIDGKIMPIDGGAAHLAVLMDIRDELKENNKLISLLRREITTIRSDTRYIEKRLAKRIKLK